MKVGVGLVAAAVDRDEGWWRCPLMRRRHYWQLEVASSAWKSLVSNCLGWAEYSYFCLFFYYLGFAGLPGLI
jgi:hypothetical protein